MLIRNSEKLEREKTHHPMMAWETVDDDMGWHPLLHLLQTVEVRKNYGE